MIKIKILGLAKGDHWVASTDEQIVLTVKREEAKDFAEESEAFEFRRVITKQMPTKVIVTFDLEK